MLSTDTSPQQRQGTNSIEDTGTIARRCGIKTWHNDISTERKELEMVRPGRGMSTEAMGSVPAEDVLLVSTPTAGHLTGHRRHGIEIRGERQTMFDQMAGNDGSSTGI